MSTRTKLKRTTRTDSGKLTIDLMLRNSGSNTLGNIILRLRTLSMTLIGRGLTSDLLRIKDKSLREEIFNDTDITSTDRRIHSEVDGLRIPLASLS